MISLYVVRNLHCAGCAARIEDDLTRLPNVDHVSIDLSTNRVRVEGSAPVALEDLNRIADAVEPGTRIEEWHEGMDAAGSASGHNAGGQGGDGEASDRMVIARMALCGLLLACGLLFGSRLEQTLPPVLVNLLFYGLPYALCGYGVLIKGWQSLIRKDFFNEFTLMGGATLAAIAIGELPEAVGVMLFYCVGEYVQERAAGNSRRSIRALLAARPTVAHLLEGDAVVDRAPESLRPGMVILVKPGEKIPLDGVVLSGTSQVDTSPLTGEPVPVAAKAGGKVFAGTVNLDGSLTITVTALYADSSVARILEMVESATARKAPTERFITRFARYYTPAVVVAAALVALVPPLMGMGSFHDWLYRALVLLVISCPCALVISIPLGYFGGIGAASRRGILVKGGNVLDALRNVRAVAFDKTGTLTHGVFAVSQLVPAPGVSEATLLEVAALAESGSNHPIARSVIKAHAASLGHSTAPTSTEPAPGDRAAAVFATAPLAAGSAPSDGASVTPEARHALSLGLSEIQEIPGKGVSAQYQGQRLLAGNSALLEAHGITPTAVDGPGSVVYVARDADYLGALVVSDILRPESAATVRALHDMGISTVAMLTGDRAEGAAWVAKELDLDAVRSGLLPEDKAAALESLAPRGQSLFVGDGINDAPVLASAGVSVAMGGLGAEAAIEIADVVILDDSPARLVELLHIAARTRAIVWQNIVMALSIKGLFIGLGIVGLSGLWEAVFADVGVALLAVLNASRASRVSTTIMPSQPRQVPQTHSAA